MSNSIHPVEIQILLNAAESFGVQPETFIETGTSLGKTVFALSPFFKKCITIEIDKSLTKKAAKKAAIFGLTNITFICGDSAVELGKVLDSAEEEDLVVFLDGHYCGDGRSEGGNKDTGRGELDVPLIEELHHINKYKGRLVLIIDDVKLFEKNKEEANGADWSHITRQSILSSLDEDRILHQFFSNIDDRWVLILDYPE